MASPCGSQHLDEIEQKDSVDMVNNDSTNGDNNLCHDFNISAEPGNVGMEDSLIEGDSVANDNADVNCEQPMEVNDNLQDEGTTDEAVAQPAQLLYVEDNLDHAALPVLTFETNVAPALPFQSGSSGDPVGCFPTDHDVGNLIDDAGDAGIAIIKEEPQKECIRLDVVSQRQRKTIVVDPDYDVMQLKSLVQAKFQVDMDQICLIKDKKILLDNVSLRDLNLVEGDEIHLAIRYYPQSEQSLCEGEPTTQSFYWPSQYLRLGLVNFDLSELQEVMQKQFNESPELVREALMNPMIQDLMSDPSRVKDMMTSCPGGAKLLEKRPDIAEALNDPKFMEESLNIAQDQGLLEDTLGRMEALKDPQRVPTIPAFTVQDIPSSEMMMKMMSQDPEMLSKMFGSLYYKAMVEGMVANPAWTEKMLLHNPLLTNNHQMKQQIKSFLPQFLNQLQSPEYVAMMSNPRALRSMMKIQQGITNLQNEAANLTASAGFPNYSTPGTFNIQIEGDAEPGGATRANRGEVDPMSIMMGQIIRQSKEGSIGLPLAERYAKDLELMEQMGFPDRQTNLALLAATFGDVNAAASQLLL